jgi:hypothetical protein
MYSIFVRILVDAGLCILFAFPFPKPEIGYGWLWLMAALYSIRMTLNIWEFVTRWICFHLVSKAEMIKSFTKLLQTNCVNQTNNYFDAESYLALAGAPLNDYLVWLDSLPQGDKGIEAIDPHLLASSIRSGLFASEAIGALDTAKILAPFTTAVMLKIGLRDAALKHYRPEGYRASFADALVGVKRA